MSEMNVTFETMPRAIEQLVAEVREIKAKINAPAVTQTPERDRLLVNEALALLAELGRPTSKSTLYKETSTGAIPHYKIGKRLVFSRKALTQWVEQGMPDQSQLNAADRLAVTLNKKGLNNGK